MRINIYAHLIIIEILDEIYAREQTWSTVEYYVTRHHPVNFFIRISLCI